MTRDEANSLRKKLEAILDEINEQDDFPVKLTLGPCKFGHSATFKLVCDPKTSSGEVVSAEAVAYQKHAKYHNMDPNWLNAEFEFRHTDYRLIGAVWSRYKFPILVERIRDGKRFKFATKTIIDFLS